ncbi:MAG: glycosylhydrolase-like jelly roll fold domain-containing protein, partial [Maribacter sp.]
ITTDLNFTQRDDMVYTHRKKGNTDIYFLYNPDKSATVLECNFNIKDKIPELWNPVTGQTKKLGQFKQEGGVTKTWIPLEAEESVFVVFRESSKGVPAVTLENHPKSITDEFILGDKNQLQLKTSENGTYNTHFNSGERQELTVKNIKAPISIDKGWKVAFLGQQEVETTVTFDSLIDWKDHNNQEIKYYSGTATYHKTFNFDLENTIETDRFILDLGKVSIAAEVIINGQNLGVLWMAPFKVDITQALKNGANNLEIKVTNQWTNRLIGDERFAATDEYSKTDALMPAWYVNNEPMPVSERTTFTTAQFYNANSPLLSAGLVGPVYIHNEQIIAVK